MNADELRYLLDRARQLACTAAQAILEFAGDPCATAKEDGSPLTLADMASHKTIDEGLRSLHPRLSILSEEGDLDGAETRPSGAYWCVDPLDGTKEFVNGLGEYTVNIALVEQADPVLGVVCVPASSTVYFAARGHGAWRTRGSGPPQRIAPRDRDRPSVAVVSRSHMSDRTTRFLAKLGVSEVIRRGSSLKMCAVADGSADIYPRLGPTCLWDTAAGTAVCREAGCRVVDLHGCDLDYDPGKGLKREGFLVFPAAMRLPPIEGGD